MPNKTKPLGLGAAFLLLTAPAMAGQTNNHGIHSVPVPGKVTVDGRLEDWDRSGEILVTYDIETLRDVYSARVSAMHDAEAFYLAIHWKDSTPMGNSHHPRYQANWAWAGDAVQLRFKTDRIAHVTAWYYGPTQEPAMQIAYGRDLQDPFGGGDDQLFRESGWKMQKGAEMAFLKDEDGRGYVQEIKIPWALLTKGKNPVAGDKFSLGMEFLWGQTDWPEHRYADNLAPGASSREFFWTAHANWGPVTLEPKGKLKLPEPAYMVEYRRELEGDAVQGPVEISYNLPRDARVSLAIDDETGRRVRNLVPALPRKKGKNTEKWDGLGDNGKPLQPGKYTYRALYQDGIRANYVLSFASPGNPSWDTDDNRGAFYGDHSAPQAAAAAGQYVAVACPMGEAGKHLIGLDLNGQRIWGLHNRSVSDVGRVSLATDGATLWVANQGVNSTIYRVDMATGKYKPWKANAKDAKGNDFPLLDLKVAATPVPEGSPMLKGNLMGIAYQANKLAVCLSKENVVLILDSTTGQEVDRLPVEAPRSVTYLPGGSLVVLSKGSLWELKKGQEPRAFTTQAITDIHSVVADATGNVYVSVRGEDQNVKVLSPQGAVLREIGQRGGRPAVGPYLETAMRLPAQIAIDSQNRLWVAEETMNPKRTSVWNTTTGELIKDLPGTTSYAGAGSLNPYDKTMGFADDVVYKVDWEKGTYKPVWSLGKQEHPDALFPAVVHDLKNRVVQRDGKTYVYTTGSGATSIETRVTLWDGKTWRPTAFFGMVPPEKALATSPRYKHPAFTGQGNKFFCWTDGNGDGLVQKEELQFTNLSLDGTAVTPRSYLWGQLPQTDGTVVYLLQTAKGPMAQALLKLPLNGVGPAGAPLYDLASPQFVKLERHGIGGGNGQGMIIGGSHGRVYLNQDPVITVDKDGKVLGGYPNKHISVHGSHNATAARPGYLIGPSSIVGTAPLPGEGGEVFYMNGNLGENTIFTQDGLFVQSLFKDVRGYFNVPRQASRGMSMDAATAGGESFGGHFVRAEDGKYYLTQGGTDARVLEISGLDTLTRFGGEVNFTAEQYLLAETQRQEKAARENAPKIYTVKRATAAPKLDGKMGDWPELAAETAAAMDIQDNPRRRFARVVAQYDDTNLYLAYLVNGNRFALRNAGQDERHMFKTGDAVDLMLGPEKGSKGNLRLLLTRRDNKPLAVLNQKVAPGAPPSEGFVFASPWRNIPFDRVVVTPEVTMAHGAVANGYLVEAAIPWKTLGVTPAAGLKLRGDVGLLSADTGGTQTVARQYWSNKETGLVNDIPGEADLAPTMWGTLVLE